MAKFISWNTVDAACRNEKLDKIEYWANKYGVCSRITLEGSHCLLHFAATYGLHKLIEDWSARGMITDVNVQTGGIMPIHFAAMGSHNRTLEVLLDLGADVNSRLRPGNYSRKGDSPPILLVSPSRLDTIDLLAERGADMLAVNSSGENLLHRMCLSKNIVESEVSRIAKRFPLLMEAKNDMGRTPLRDAWGMGSLKICESFVSMGADPKAIWTCVGDNVWDILGRFKEDRWQAVRALVKWGCPLDEHAVTLLESSLKAGKFGMADALNQAGVRLSDCSQEDVWLHLTHAGGKLSWDETSTKTMKKLFSWGYTPSDKAFWSLCGVIGRAGFLSDDLSILFNSTKEENRQQKIFYEMALCADYPELSVKLVEDGLSPSAESLLLFRENHAPSDVSRMDSVLLKRRSSSMFSTPSRRTSAL